jgi:hypothetical protein
MSLINDALKRASNPNTLTATPPPYGAPVTMVEAPPRTGPMPVILCIVGVGALFMAGAFWLKSKGTPSPEAELRLARQATALSAPVQSGAGQTAAAPQSDKAASPTVGTEGVIAQPKPAFNPVEKAATTLQKVVERGQGEQDFLPFTSAAPVTESVAPTAAAVAPTVAISEPKVIQKVQQPASPKPNYRLQAIYYRMKGPTVVINGKTLRVGDSIDGAKLLSIERSSVELDTAGVKHHLTMH